MKSYTKFFIAVFVSIFLLNADIFSAGGDNIYTVGQNLYGELGDGTNGNGTNKNIPNLIGAVDNWVAVSAGRYHTIAIDKDGQLWAWGRNNYGQLGDGKGGDNTDDHNTDEPILVDDGSTGSWVYIASGAYHNFGIKSNGTLWAWGYNATRHLGDGSAVLKKSPVQIGNKTDWLSVSTGYNHSMGIDNSGQLWVWGYNQYGQLGDSTLIGYIANPTAIEVGEKWLSISAGYYHSLGIKSDGSLWAWGYNSLGQLGDNTDTNRISPVAIAVGEKWSSVTGGYNHSLGIKSDSSLWAWGNNSSGQLGTGNYTSYKVPVAAAVGEKWLSISAGYYHSLGVKVNRTPWVWGRNVEGQLGDGSNSTRNSPVSLQIGNLNPWECVSATAGYFHSTALIAIVAPATIAYPFQTRSVTASSAKCGAEVLTDGGGTIEERGICYSTSSMPDISGDHVVAPVAEVGSFDVSISGLQASTKYYVRAYVKNVAGITYSDERVFVTAP